MRRNKKNQMAKRNNKDVPDAQLQYPADPMGDRPTARCRIAEPLMQTQDVPEPDPRPLSQFVLYTENGRPV